VLLVSSSAQQPQLERRHRVGSALKDGILLLHATSQISGTTDAFRQDPFFYYFTGLADTVGAILAIDAKSGESWLFVPPTLQFSYFSLSPNIVPGAEAERRLGIDHVENWLELNSFLADLAQRNARVFYASGGEHAVELPENLLKAGYPAWLEIVLRRWPSLMVKDASNEVAGLLSTQSPEELERIRLAAKATVSALMSGMRAIKPNVAQRDVELAVVKRCSQAGASTEAFWPWVMSGETAVFPAPPSSDARYDHLNRPMKSGDLVRLDVGCEKDHYGGDLGRTVPVSGHYDPGQRETWEIFVAAYLTAARTIRSGATVNQVFDTWSQELKRHLSTAQTKLAKDAIRLWIDRKNVPYWQIHTTNLLAWSAPEPFKVGTTINFEPIATVDGQAFFIEDMYVITKQGSQILTPGAPYSADQIEAKMR